LFSIPVALEFNASGATPRCHYPIIFPQRSHHAIADRRAAEKHDHDETGTVGMTDFVAAFQTAFAMIVTLDAGLMEIVGLSLRVNFTAVGLAVLIGLPVGAAVAIFPFPGRRVLVVVMNALMGMPPVVVGLIVYLLLSRAGPFGVLGLLFTPTAMIIAQCILVTPIVAALTRQTIGDLWTEYRDQLRSLGAGAGQTLRTLLWEGRFSLSTAVLAGFGRASAEVGAVMIVGGNIDHLTRVMTTAIALEVSKGDLSLALGLGIILISLSLCVNSATFVMNEIAQRRHG
jgi:tungstate transport system permease protein